MASYIESITPVIPIPPIFYEPIPQMTTSLAELFELITIDLMDYIVSSVLPSFDQYEYIVYGGKALNNILKPTVLAKSFDFDIHYYGKHDQTDLNRFGSQLTDQMNDFLRQSDQQNIRQELYQRLLFHDLVTDNERQYYLYNNLFYYGKKIKKGQTHYGIVIDLKLGNTFFQRYKKSLYFYKSKILTKPNVLNPKKINLFQYSIIDLVLDRELNFGYLAGPEDIVMVNNIHYLKYIPAIYNLLMYSHVGGYKQQKTVYKALKFDDINNYNPTFLNYLKMLMNLDGTLNTQFINFLMRINIDSYSIITPIGNTPVNTTIQIQWNVLNRLSNILQLLEQIVQTREG